MEPESSIVNPLRVVEAVLAEIDPAGNTEVETEPEEELMEVEPLTASTPLDQSTDETLLSSPHPPTPLALTEAALGQLEPLAEASLQEEGPARPQSARETMAATTTPEKTAATAATVVTAPIQQQTPRRAAPDRRPSMFFVEPAGRTVIEQATSPIPPPGIEPATVTTPGLEQTSAPPSKAEETEEQRQARADACFWAEMRRTLDEKYRAVREAEERERPRVMQRQLEMRVQLRKAAKQREAAEKEAAEKKAAKEVEKKTSEAGGQPEEHASLEGGQGPLPDRPIGGSTEVGIVRPTPRQSTSSAPRVSWADEPMEEHVGALPEEDVRFLPVPSRSLIEENLEWDRNGGAMAVEEPARRRKKKAKMSKRDRGPRQLNIDDYVSRRPSPPPSPKTGPATLASVRGESQRSTGPSRLPGHRPILETDS